MNAIQQLNEVREKLAMLDPNNRDHLGEISNLKTKEAELLQLAEVEQRVESAIVETAEAVDNLELMPGLTLRDIVTDPQAYQLVSIAFKGIMNDKDTKYINELTELSNKYKDELRASDDREAQLKRQNDVLQKDVDLINEANAELRRQVNTLIFERDEAYKVRDNAAAEIEGLRLVLAEKDKHIDTLRAEMAVGAKGAQQVDQSEQLKKAHEEWLASRIKVTNIRWSDDLKKTHYNAELISGETITFGRLEKGKYLEVSSEDAERFRAEAESSLQIAATVQADGPALVVEPVEAPVIQEVQQFPEETGLILDAGFEVADEQPGVQSPTVEERLAALEVAVFGQVKGVA